MIISRINGGLGNQMFQYAMAKSMAKKNNDIFKLDLSFYPKQNLRKYELNLLNIKEDIALKNECISLRSNEGIFYKIKNKFGLKIDRPKTYYREKEVVIFDKDIVTLTGNIYLDGFWQNENYFKDIREEILKDFVPKQGISSIAEIYLKQIETTVNSVSIHIRRGDYVENSNTNAVHGVCSIDYYLKAITYIKKRIDRPIFYIFSDDIFWCKKNFDFLDHKVFVDQTKSAIDDLELMKRCKHNIIANSTFSWWGAWLNQNQNKIIITPQRWFSLNPDLHLAPKEWIKL